MIKGNNSIYPESSVTVIEARKSWMGLMYSILAKLCVLLKVERINLPGALKMVAWEE